MIGQEDFLSSRECLLLIEGEERPLAGRGISCTAHPHGSRLRRNRRRPCVIFMTAAGARQRDRLYALWLAIRHGAGVVTERARGRGVCRRSPSGTDGQPKNLERASWPSVAAVRQPVSGNATSSATARAPRTFRTSGARGTWSHRSNRREVLSGESALRVPTLVSMTQAARGIGRNLCTSQARALFPDDAYERAQVLQGCSSSSTTTSRRSRLPASGSRTPAAESSRIVSPNACCGRAGARGNGSSPGPANVSRRRTP